MAIEKFRKIGSTSGRFVVSEGSTHCGPTTAHEALPAYTQKELDYLDEMFEKRIEDPRA